MCVVNTYIYIKYRIFILLKLHYYTQFVSHTYKIELYLFFDFQFFYKTLHLTYKKKKKRGDTPLQHTTKYDVQFYFFYLYFDYHYFVCVVNKFDIIEVLLVEVMARVINSCSLAIVIIHQKRKPKINSKLKTHQIKLNLYVCQLVCFLSSINIFKHNLHGFIPFHRYIRCNRYDYNKKKNV